MPSPRRRRKKDADALQFGHLDQLHPHLLWIYDGTIPEWGSTTGHYDGQTSGVWFLRSGSLTLNFDRETERHRGPCWLLPKSSNGTQLFSGDSRLLSIRFTLKWPDNSPFVTLDKTLSFHSGSHRRFEQASQALVQFVEKELPGDTLFLSERFAPPIVIASLFSRFWNWVEEYLRVLRAHDIPFHPRTALDPRVAVALSHIQTLSLVQPLNEKSVAASCGLSVAHLNRLFHQQLGQSPAQIRDQRRDSEACEALLYSQESIKSLAYRMGFSSPQHFSFWFRKRKTCTPREFRAQRLGEYKLARR